MMPPMSQMNRVERGLNCAATDVDVASKAYPDPSFSPEEEKTWVNMMTDRVFIPENNKLPDGFIPDHVCSIEMVERNDNKENYRFKRSRGKGRVNLKKKQLGPSSKPPLPPKPLQPERGRAADGIIADDICSIEMVERNDNKDNYRFERSRGKGRVNLKEKQLGPSFRPPLPKPLLPTGGQPSEGILADNVCSIEMIERNDNKENYRFKRKRSRGKGKVNSKKQSGPTSKPPLKQSSPDVFIPVHFCSIGTIERNDNKENENHISDGSRGKGMVNLKGKQYYKKEKKHALNRKPFKSLPG